ncbi:MAG: alpha/beta hydrolase [Desulfobacterales bacterium]
MTSPDTPDYGILDRPEILAVLFHPRASYGGNLAPSRDLMIPVEESIAVGAGFHIADPAGATILFFHGNGEIVADYNDLGPLYTRMGVNFLAVDYRGYGHSGGRPTVAAMMADAEKILDWILAWRRKNGHTGPLAVMGRSLGSAPALELAARRSADIDGLIIESGFARAAPLLQLLGVSPAAIGFREEAGFANIEKIKQVKQPTLIIHAEFDHIIPYAEAKELYAASPAAEKSLLTIPGANHNDIFARGLSEYLMAVKELTSTLRKPFHKNSDD